MRAGLSALGGLVVVIAVVAEAARLDIQQGHLGESIKHVVEQLDSLLQGEGRRDVQVQDVKTDLQELRRDVTQQRVEEAAGRGAQKQVSQQPKQQQPIKKPGQ
jgi:hypothetical protein